MNAQNTNTVLFIGQPCVFGDMASPDKTGWIADIEEQEGRVFTLGAGGMTQQKFRVTVAWDNNTLSKVSEGVARPWIAKAEVRGIEAKSPAVVAELLKEAQTAEQERRELAARERAEREREVSDWRDSIRAKVPAEAKAVIVAEFEQDQSDSMTDYFATTTTKTVILAFSRHTRDLFPEMRKAARNYEATAHLAEAGADAEHREKYSMGAGYYLKASHHYSDGWKVSKRPITGQSNDPAAYVPFGEWSVPEGQPFATGNAERRTAEPKEAATATDAGGFTIEEHTHTKRGFQMWIVSPKVHAPQETFSAWLATAKERKGWYSRKWGSTPAGFAFKCPEVAKAFADELAG